MIDLTLVEVMRRNMVAFCEHFIENETMSKDDFYDLQKKVIDEIKKEMKE